jgi:hypothetical protein
VGQRQEKQAAALPALPQGAAVKGAWEALKGTSWGDGECAICLEPMSAAGKKLAQLPCR